MCKIKFFIVFIILSLTMGFSCLTGPESNNGHNDSNISNQALPNSEEVTKQFGNDNYQTFIKDDSFLGDPNNLLGQVFCIRKDKNNCNSLTSINKVTFEAYAVVDSLLNRGSIDTKPTLRSSRIINKKIAANINFLSYISGGWEEKDIINIQVIDQALARVNEDDKWVRALNKYKSAHKELFQDANICYIFVIKGYVQKNIISKSFKSDSLSSSGGIYGIKVDGKYYHSDESYDLDIVFGLSSSVLKRPSNLTNNKSISHFEIDLEPTDSEKQLLSAINHIEK